MKEYYLYYPSRDAPIIGQTELRHTSDEEAICAALELSKGQPLELWEGQRIVIKFHAPLARQPPR